LGSAPKGFSRDSYQIVLHNLILSPHKRLASTLNI
jgi:hypothetical protein